MKRSKCEKFTDNKPTLMTYFKIIMGFVAKTSIEEEVWWVSLTGLTMSHVCACPKTRLTFPTVYVMFFVFIELK